MVSPGDYCEKNNSTLMMKDMKCSFKTKKPLSVYGCNLYLFHSSILEMGEMENL